MTEDNTERLLQMNERLLFVMGFAITIMIDLRKNALDPDKQAIDWVIHAIKNIVYLNKPLPPLPPLS